MTTAAPPLAARVANARMYAVDTHVAALWKQLFARVAQEASVDLDVIDHAAPRPLPDLWRRADLGCAFICGYPWVTWNERAVAQPALLAAPLPSAARYGGRAVYCTDFVVRSDSRFVNVDDLRGARFAYTVEHSQSGCRRRARISQTAHSARAAAGSAMSSVPCTRRVPSWPRSSRIAPMRGRSIRGGLICCSGTTLQQHRSCGRSQALL